MNIGFTHNCELRNNGTATYMLRAARLLKDAGELEDFKHYQGRGPVEKHDWYLWVDDGRDDLTWTPPHPWAYWAVDTHLGYGYRLWKAQHADRVFVAQKDAVARLSRDGVQRVEWLPLACHAEAHPNKGELLARGMPAKDLTRIWDWAFVGFMQDSREIGTNNRTDYLQALWEAFRNCWISCGAFFEAMAIRFIRAQFGFNVSIKRDLNMRVFEVMSTGTPLLTNRNVEGITDLFVEGENYIGYEGPEEMVAQAGKMLRGEYDLDRIAGSAFTKVRQDHTYSDRLLAICEAMSHV